MGNVSRSEQKRAVIYPLAAGFVVPGLVGMFQPGLIQWFFVFLFFVIVGFLPAYVIFRVVYAWINGAPFFRTLLVFLRPLPAGLPIGTDLKTTRFPLVTALLIVVNIFFHLIFSDSAKSSLAFPPCSSVPPLWGGLALFMHAFLHGSHWHLAGNMIFLWVFGSTLEVRTGPKRFCAIYLACIVAAAFFYCLMMLFSGTSSCGIGASGAIAGIMGVFAVRCYFANVTIGLPFLFIPWLTVPVRVQALVLICLFFAMDTAGSLAMFGPTSSNVGYWAHTGGYLFGFALAFMLGYQRLSSKESLGVKAGRLSAGEFDKKKAADLYQEVLRDDPRNLEALTFFLEYYRHSPQKQPYIFGILLKVLTGRNIDQAVEVFNDYYPRYLHAVPGQTAFILGVHFHKTLALKKARNCLEIASGKSGPWQAKATLLLGQVFEDMGSTDRAGIVYREVQAAFPGTDFAREARRREEAMTSTS